MTTTTDARTPRVMLVYGTRPEAIKVAPLVRALHADPRFTPAVVVTGQHRQMLDQVNDFFGITPDTDLDVHTPGQTLTEVTVRTLEGVGAAIEEHRPDLLLAQGDTTSAFTAGLAAFYYRLPRDPGAAREHRRVAVRPRHGASGTR